MHGNNNLMMSSQVYTLIGNIDILVINSSQKKINKQKSHHLIFKVLISQKAENYALLNGINVMSGAF